MEGPSAVLVLRLPQGCFKLNSLVVSERSRTGMAALRRRKAAGRRQSESRVRENRTHGLTRGRWGDHFKPGAYSTRMCGLGLRFTAAALKVPQSLRDLLCSIC